MSTDGTVETNGADQGVGSHGSFLGHAGSGTTSAGRLVIGPR